MKLLTVQNLADATGESASVWRKRIRQRELPFVRCGRNVRIRQADFDTWLDQRIVTISPAADATPTQRQGGLS